MEDKAFNSLKYDQLNGDQKTALEAAIDAIQSSHSPYSKFEVGAALLLENGEIIKGSNQENIAYPSGICAERSALFTYGSAASSSKINILAVVARHHGSDEWATGAPCGGCRQVMLEYERLQKTPYEVIFRYDDQYIITSSARSLLPYDFHM
jgi:cytidine deaminase